MSTFKVILIASLIPFAAVVLSIVARGKPTRFLPTAAQGNVPLTHGTQPARSLEQPPASLQGQLTQLQDPLALPTAAKEALARRNRAGKQEGEQEEAKPGWVIVTVDGQVLMGELPSIPDLELKLKYGSVTIPAADIVTVNRCEFQMPGPDSTVKTVEGLVVATTQGSILIGEGKLSDLSIESTWGSMNVKAEKIGLISNKALGLRRLAYNNENWGLFPLQIRQMETLVEGRNESIRLTAEQRPNIRLRH